MSRKRRTPRTPTVVFDFGGVLSHAHDPVPDLHELLGGDAAALADAYWSARSDFDRGAIDREQYWTAVASGAGLDDPDEEEIRELQEMDDRYWLQLDPPSRDLLHDLARNRVRMALLTNASEAFGEAVRRADWFEAVGFAIVSGEEKVVKPDPEIYRILLDTLAHETGGVSVPSEVIFFDDREENIEAARELGIDAHLWPRNGEEPADGDTGIQIARRVLAGRGVPLD